MKSLAYLLALTIAASAARTRQRLVDQSYYPSARTAHVTAPIVTLPYEKHQAILNETGKYYNFSNIPYAQPPIGNLRFAKPEAIVTKSDIVNDGKTGRICPQAQPDWVDSALYFIFAWTVGWSKKSQAAHMKIRSLLKQQQDPRISEDCLLLDVVVPKRVWERKDGDTFPPAPVMVSIHGGGFTFGDKNLFGRPTGLFNASGFADGQESLDDSEGIIYVTLNYRLGAFGWLSSPDFIKQGGASNAGLLDQLAALQWVKKYITLFNGDPNRVTVAGQSAGAASILHHLISYAGGKLSFGSNRPDPPAFQRAIIQSPAFFPLADDKQEESIYNNFLGSSGTDNVEDLRAADTNILQYVNSVMIQSSDYGQFTFGPSVDDLLIPAPASLLLGRGIKWPNIQILVGDTINEGLLFSPPNVASDSEFRSLISKKLPGMKKADIDEVLRMYPIDAKSTPAQRTQRVANAISELGVVCNTRYLLEAYRGGYNYNYKFGVHPGFHGQDAFFTYYEPPYTNEPYTEAVGNFSRVTGGTEEVAQALQGYFSSFVQYGDPNVAGLGPEWYNEGFLNITSRNGSGGPLDQIGNIIYVEPDELDADLIRRCDWWKEAPYWNPEDEDSSMKLEL